MTRASPEPRLDRRIELLGLPGAGKTTWLEQALVGCAHGVVTREAFEARISAEHVRRGRAARWADFAGFVGARPGLARGLADYAASIRGARRRDRARHVYRMLRHLHNQALYRARGAGARPVLDQGPIQQLWAVAMLEVPAEAALEAAFDALDGWLPAGVIWIRVEPALALTRMRARLAERGVPDGDFEERASRLTADDFARGERHFAQIARALERRGARVELVRGDAAVHDPAALQVLLDG